MYNNTGNSEEAHHMKRIRGAEGNSMFAVVLFWQKYSLSA